MKSITLIVAWTCFSILSITSMMAYAEAPSRDPVTDLLGGGSGSSSVKPPAELQDGAFGPDYAPPASAPPAPARRSVPRRDPTVDELLDGPASRSAHAAPTAADRSAPVIRSCLEKNPGKWAFCNCIGAGYSTKSCESKLSVRTGDYGAGYIDPNAGRSDRRSPFLKDCVKNNPDQERYCACLDQRKPMAVCKPLFKVMDQDGSRLVEPVGSP